jgi:hypothetical protein
MKLDHSQADILQKILVSAGLGTDPESESDWPIAVESELSSPENTITIYSTPGTPDGRDMKTKEALEHYGIQVRIRGSNHPLGYLKAAEIRQKLETLYRETTSLNRVTDNGTVEYRVNNAARIGSIFNLGPSPEAPGRRLFTINCTLCIDLI